ncbi:MAG: methionine--tRNA ligase [Candidatus Omnitrophica bacterium]|nr:methionine--tRNA ligase [Candidatus Omnitrophota bacterium]
MSRGVYITTPLYYVNASPHIGHAYTNVISDTLARYFRLEGEEVFFLTGTDEHGQKVKNAALAEGKEVKEFTDNIVDNFIALWRKLNISYDDFIRTTQARHVKVVKEALIRLHKRGDIYLSVYKGFYCMPCESFWLASQLKEGKFCPDCGREVEEVEEKNYFFRLSRYQDWLQRFLKSNPGFIFPDYRYNEVLSFVENSRLSDLCISRPKSRVDWGIEIPFDKNYVTYVWFDALLNYISAAGAFFDEERFSRLWPAEVHFIGKDILRQHAVYWPIMLKALGLEMPKRVVAHGWWLAGEEGKDKISKSKGNVVGPDELIDEFGSDALRFFLLREVPLGLDGKFSRRALILRINSDLSNDWGNLVFRSLNMLAKYFHSRLPEAKKSMPSRYISIHQNLYSQYQKNMKRANFTRALEEVWKLITAANKSIEEEKPWQLYKDKKTDELSYFIYHLFEAIRVACLFLYPFLPSSCRDIYRRFTGKDILTRPLKEAIEWGSLEAGQLIDKGNPLFPRFDVD